MTIIFKKVRKALKWADLPILHIRGHRFWPCSAQVEGSGLAGTSHDIIITQPSALHGMFIKLISRNWTSAHLPEPPPIPDLILTLQKFPHLHQRLDVHYVAVSLTLLVRLIMTSEHVAGCPCTPSGGFRRNSTALISNIWEMSRKWGYN